MEMNPEPMTNTAATALVMERLMDDVRSCRRPEGSLRLGQRFRRFLVKMHPSDSSQEEEFTDESTSLFHKTSKLQPSLTISLRNQAKQFEELMVQCQLESYPPVGRWPGTEEKRCDRPGGAIQSLIRLNNFWLAHGGLSLSWRVPTRQSCWTRTD